MGLRTHNLRERTTRALRPSQRRTRLRDRFELLVPIGSGGFGTVWEGFDMLLERPVAIKELRLDDTETELADALREARATARLNHPAIVSLYEVIDEQDRIYMVNELVRGHTLATMISDHALSDNDAARIGYALCEALAHAHQQGVVHRDVKPANVMVTSAWLEGSGGWRVQPAKLMDFGIASIVDPGEHGGHAHAGPHAGSRGYVAPEQQAGYAAGPASDVYSLALVLFECFTGSPPGKGRRGRLARVRRDLPPELSWTIDRCLESEPHLRPTVVELAEAIHDALPQLTHELAAPTLSSRLSSLFGRRPREQGRATAPPARARRDLTKQPPALERIDAPLRTRLWRPALAALAAALCCATMLAADLALAPLPPLIAAALVFAMPRAGWTLAATAGAVAFAADGQVGSALFLVLPAVVAALAAMIPLPRVFDGALAGAGAFAWVVAVQAISGVSLALGLPPNFDDAEAVRRYADVALHSLQTLATPAYAASLGLWALAGVACMLLADRRTPLAAWLALATLLAAVQALIGALLGAAVPAVLIAAAVVFAALALAAAWSGRRMARVFSRPSGAESRRVSV